MPSRNKILLIGLVVVALLLIGAAFRPFKKVPDATNGTNATTTNATSTAVVKPGTTAAPVVWQKYTPPNKLFTADLPSVPQISTGTTTTAQDVEYTYNYYQAVTKDSVFVINNYIYAKEIDISQPDTLLKNILTSYVGGDADKKIATTSYSATAGFRSLNFLIQGSVYNFKGKVVLAGQVPYLVLMTYEPNKYNDTDYQRFITSFKPTK
jgi:hypothetical protein